MKNPPASKKLPRRSFSTEPVHVRLSELCRRAIVDGDFAAGEKFPSERELAERYDVSRATANKVISALITEGLLDLKKGVGTRVRQRRTLFASLGGMESFTAHASERGLEPTTEVLKFERILSSALPDEVCAGLDVFQKPKRAVEPIIYLERLRLADGVPMILEHRWVRESLVPSLNRGDVEGSFYRAVEEKFGLPMTGEQHSISAVLLDDIASGIFRIEEPTASLLVEGTGFVKGNTPLWYQRLFYRGDRYQLHNETRGAVASEVKLRLQKKQFTA